MAVTKFCPVCRRFRRYEPADRFCSGCGAEALIDGCECGRSFDYALNEDNDIYCPRCGKRYRGGLTGEGLQEEPGPDDA